MPAAFGRSLIGAGGSSKFTPAVAASVGSDESVGCETLPTYDPFRGPREV